MTLKPATLADCQTVYEFVCDLEEETLDFEAFQRIYQHNIQHPDYHYLIAWEGATPVGYASVHTQWLLHHNGQVGEIQEMYVMPAWRGRGVGNQLLSSIEHIALNQGWVILEVTANQKRTATHRFYEAHGLEQTHYKFVKKIT